MEGEELVEAGYVAEDVFLRQMRRLRAKLGLTQEQLAKRVVAMGGNMHQQTIAKLENGSRALKLSEADLLAQALGSSVQDMLFSAISGVADDPTKNGPSLAELEAELHATDRRFIEAREELAALTARSAAAHEAAEQARRAATRAEHEVAVVEAQTMLLRSRAADLQRQYDYLAARFAAAEAAEEKMRRSE